MNRMTRTALVLCFVACGGGKPAKVSNTSGGAGSAAPTTPETVAECTGTVENARAGNHDRYAFEGPDGLYGYKNKKGDVVIAPTLKYAYEFKPGGIAAAVDGNATFVFIDTSGKVIAQAYAFDNGPDYFQEGHARIVDTKRKVGFINDKGQITFAPRFDQAESFCYGKAQVSEGGKQIYVDVQGNPTTPPDKQPPTGGSAEEG